LLYVVWCEEKYLESGEGCVRDLMMEAVSFPPAEIQGCPGWVQLFR
jgi:hypothetical protein